MLEALFSHLTNLDSVFWGYINFALILLLGCYLTLQARFFQITALPSILATFYRLLAPSTQTTRGIHPLKAFFASVGGMIGVGNVVGIATAVQIGGPGALVWVWVAALIGTIIKYSEIFLGLKHRVKNDRGSYDGGPMYFLRGAFNNRFVPIFIAVLLCIYGVEIYQFTVLTDSLSTNLPLNRYVVIALLLGLVLYASVGGVARIGKICTCLMPVFVISYMTMGCWVLFQEAAILPQVFKSVFISAFTGHAAMGGFAGSTVLLAIQHGIARAAYSADLGIGYDSIIQSESSTVHPERQARLAILGVCIDNLVCTMTILIVLVSGVWYASDPLEGSQLVQTALSRYFPYMHIFMPAFLFVAGYMTIIAYFCVGIKCARFLHPRYGFAIYVAYGISIMVLFSFFNQTQAMLVMSLAGAMLMFTNLLGIFKLRHEIIFAHEAQEGVPQLSLAEENG